jgi:hypothetical protein
MYSIESGYSSLNKYKEELCGDCVEIINGDESSTMVLADGLGSGVKANILSTLTSKIIGTMMASGLKISDAVQTIAHTLPVCSERQIAYSTFSILQVSRGGDAYLVQFDNPQAIFLHDAKSTDYPMKKLSVCGKEIYESHLTLERGDMFVLVSDGVVHAGVGKIYNFGWQRDNICQFLEQHYRGDMTAKAMADMLTGACGQLYIDMPGDDATTAVMRMRDSAVLSVMIGPPVSRDDDLGMVHDFMLPPGKKAVCGGTTAQIVARGLGKKVETSIDYVDPGLPPTAKIDGVDLVTEGVLTLSRVLGYTKLYRSSPDAGQALAANDGASLLARLMLEESTDINFFVGRAINPAHQNPDFPAELSMKSRLVGELADSLKACGKRVNVRFF